MTRVLWCVVLAACAGPKGSSSARTTTPEPATSTPAAPAATTAPTTTEMPAKSSGPGAYCLFVGPKQIVVRCYWTRSACEDQIGFNKGNGLTEASECRATPEPQCFQYQHGEMCFPTTAACEKNVAAMKRHPGENPTACATKTAP